MYFCLDDDSIYLIYETHASESQVVQEALEKANLTEMDLSAVAVTIGPGLSLCLRGQ